jgi:hypothetical protein
MINLLYCSFLVTVYHFFWGGIFVRLFKIKISDNSNFSIYSLLGIIFLSFISLTFNFFIPINKLFSTSIFLLSLSIFFFEKKIFYKKIFNYLITNSLIVFLLVYLSESYRPDSGLYHYPLVNIINENKIIVGLANIHQRFGHASIIQYLSAIHNNHFIGLNGIIFPTASIASAVIIYFLKHIIRIKKFNLSNFFSIFIILYIGYKMIRYSEYGNDTPGHLILFLIVSFFLRFYEEKFLNKENIFFLISIFSVYAYLNKTFLIFLLIVPLLLNYKFYINRFNIFSFVYIFFFIFFFSIKNILNSGCIIYPAAFTCLNFNWTNFTYINNVFDVSAGSEAWSKDWSNQKGVILNYKDYINNTVWIKYWMQNHFKVIFKILIPYFIIIFILFLYLIFKKKNLDKVTILNEKIKSKIISLISVLLIGFAAWFLKGPIYRYGYSYIISIISLFFSYIFFVKFNNLSLKNLKNIKYFIIILFTLVFIGKQFNRIFEQYENTYYNYPWPKYFSSSPNNAKVELIEKVKNGKLYYYTPKKDFCYYSKSPCTSEEVDEAIKLKYIYGFKIYYFDSK